MKTTIVLSALMLSFSALAAGPKTNLVDHSNKVLIADKDALAVMRENIPAKVWKINPASRFAFVSQVEGGVKPDKTCVVAARVMLVPVTPAAKAILFRPLETATAFDAAMNSSTEQCKAMARDKLKEATQAVVSSIVKS